MRPRYQNMKASRRPDLTGLHLLDNVIGSRCNLHSAQLFYLRPVPVEVGEDEVPVVPALNP